MKKVISVLLLFLILSMFNDIEAQILNKIKQKAVQKKQQKENEAVDKIFKDAEGATGKNKNTPQKADDTTGIAGNNGINEPGKQSKKEIELWSVRYDFIPGKEILFYDDFEKEDVGEIPSKWKFMGGGMETVRTGDGAKVMKWWDRETRPNFKNEFVLPDQFTLEFDLYFEGPPRTGYGYKINFYRKGSAAVQNFIDIDYGAMHVAGLDERVPDKKKEDFYNTWHHISLSYNKGSVKGYFDQYRLFNARLKMDDNERTDYIAFYNCCTSKENGHIFLIDNVRIAEGAHAKYKEEILEGEKLLRIIFTLRTIVQKYCPIPMQKLKE